MAFGDQIYRQTNITTSKCHECETSFIKMPIVCHPALLTQKRHKTRRQSLFSAIESSMNDGALSITGLGRYIESNAIIMGVYIICVFSAIESSMNGVALSITGFCRK